jgi:hypothetical protein
MTIADLIIRARILSNDTAVANFSRETPTGRNDGTNKYFQTQNKNVIAASAFLTVNTSYRAITGFTWTDATQGLLNIDPAPTANANPFWIDYNFYWFQDTDYTEFINDAGLKLSVLDPTTVNPGLVDALLQYALGYFWQRRATQYAHKYASTGGTVGQSVEKVTEAFRELSDQAFKKGDDFRLAFYQRQGQREAPASTSTNVNVDPYTPIR